MAHLHEVKDSDTHFIINPVTMAISNAQNEKNKLQQGDHNSEIFTFQIPKEVEGHDMSLCDVVRVHYINTSTSKADISKDIHKVVDIAVAEDDAETLVFTWLIHGNATKYNGSLAFRILFACTDENDNYTYKKWTEIYKGISIGEGFENEETVLEAQADILKQEFDELEKQMEELTKELKNQNGTGGSVKTIFENIMTIMKAQVNMDGTPQAYSPDISDIAKQTDALIANLGTTNDGGTGEEENPDTGETTVTLTSISATYTGGSVTVGTALTSLTGLAVKATYSDGSTANVTGYTLSGTIAEGSNTITVSYGGKTTTFTVTGVASGGTESNIAYLPVAYKGSEYWAYFPDVVAGDVYYIRYNISSYAVLRDFSPWATVSASETTWTYEKYNDNYYKITFVTDYGDIGLATNSSWADLEYSTVKYSKNAVPVE